MLINTSGFILLSLYLLDTCLVNSEIIPVDEDKIKSDFYPSYYVKRDLNRRIKNTVGDIKSVKRGTVDRTCKKLQEKRLQKSYPTLRIYSARATFGKFNTPPAATGEESLKKYNENINKYWEVGAYEYLLLPLSETKYKKEIYHVPSLEYVDLMGNNYSVDDGYYGLHETEKGQPLFFEITTTGEAKLVAYENDPENFFEYLYG